MYAKKTIYLLDNYVPKLGLALIKSTKSTDNHDSHKYNHNYQSIKRLPSLHLHGKCFCKYTGDKIRYVISNQLTSLNQCSQKPQNFADKHIPKLGQAFVKSSENRRTQRKNNFEKNLKIRRRIFREFCCENKDIIIITQYQNENLDAKIYLNFCASSEINNAKFFGG